MNNETLIIENSHLQSNWRRISQGAITLFFWCLWGYLILPLATPLVDWLGLDITYYHKLDFDLFLGLLLTVIVVSIVLILAMAFWSFYNFILHQTCKANQWPLTKVLNQDLALYFGVKTSELGVWQQSRELNIQLNEQGNIRYVEVASLNLKPNFPSC